MCKKTLVLETFNLSILTYGFICVMTNIEYDLSNEKHILHHYLKHFKTAAGT